MRRSSRKREESFGDVADRLHALERDVESALGPDALRRRIGESVWPAIDGWLGRYADLRRWLNWEAFVRDGQAIGALPLVALYRLWWRVDAVGLERIPSTGPVLLVPNRAGTLLPYDAFMVTVASAIDHPAGRRTRPLVDEWLLRLPIVGSLLGRLGAEPASATKLRRLFEAGDAAVVFPEGRDAFAKTYAERYRVARFGRTALLRIAIEMEAPIVPIAVIGAEETHPVLWRSERGGRPLGLPALPIAPNLLPLPTKWTLYVGQPLESGTLARASGGADKAVRLVRTQLRERLQGLVSEGLGRRKSLFLA